jgi:hypothetical protein
VTVKKFNYLIIGGTTKAGTTSVYNYLSAHPQVSASYRKEVNYFLDKELGGPSLSRYDGDIETYGNNFNYECTAKIFTEASPNYLYSPGTPLKIKSSLPSVKLLFILREPYERLISWYKFGKQISELQSVSIDEFLQHQLDSQNSSWPNYLEQGKYSIFLQRYYDVLNRRDIKIVFYEDLKSRPLEFMKEICEFIEIDSEFFGDYEFYVSNKTVNLRSKIIHKYYIDIRKRLSLITPKGYSRLRVVWQYIKPMYLKLNTSTDREEVVSESIRETIKQYYSGEKKSLEKIIGREIPW